MGLSLFAGFVSSLLGIGGGIIHVPVLIHLLNFPVHIATATSHFVLVVMAFVGTCVHILMGAFSHGIRRTACLAVGVLIGAQLGAYLSNRVHGDWIVRGLAIALGFVGVRIFIMAL
ncbi:MAG: sulfite exporter TauE/SafE family protein [Deltaproteobacteria bacterium]|nr:sulfite exporter TauE/SafE family protein [Deltaproteobacteria bacterium]